MTAETTTLLHGAMPPALTLVTVGIESGRER